MVKRELYLKEIRPFYESKLIRQEKHYLFFDEIQNVNEFELVVNSFRAPHDVSIFITGSNSRLLSGELETHLSGRTVSFRILPFNFKEFCQFHGERADYDQLLAEYMRWGGFSLVCKEKEWWEIPP